MTDQMREGTLTPTPTALGDKTGVLGGPPAVRPIGAVNWRGLWTLYAREVKRFFKVGTQTLAAPVVTSLLFFIVFSVALEGDGRSVGDVPFVVFLAPGLIMMSILQNSFANTSSSLMVSKVQGNIVDVLMPPMSPLELTVAYAGGGVTRGVLVGLTTGAALWLFVDLDIHDPSAILFHGVAASVMLSLLGVIGGIWAEKFDHIAAMTNFAVVPMSFLSGTFYSIERLPGVWQDVAHFNPFFYAIDGFRYGFIGRSDSALWLSMTVMIVLNAVLFAFVYRLFATGYKLKS
jgi:ABC-2 type transport system permease protein